MPKLSKKKLLDFCEDIFKSVQVPQTDSKIAANCLVNANLRGVDGQGVRRLKQHVSMIKAGTINPNPRIKYAKECDATILLDGDHGLGHVIATQAMKESIRKAKQNGTSIVSVRNTNDFGMAANYAMLALAEDCVGIVMTNTLPLVAPWGGKAPVIGTNPICVAIPTEKEIPIVYDAATSTISHSKIELKFENSETIPKHWALDSSGNPTSDTAAALQGSLTPLGGYKGFGLGIMVDLLTGTLSGMASACNVEEISLTKKSTIGQFFATIDLAAFCEPFVFKTQVDSLIKEIKSSPVRSGFNEIVLPGERAFKTEQQNTINGIQINDRTWNELSGLASELGLQLK